GRSAAAGHRPRQLARVRRRRIRASGRPAAVAGHHLIDGYVARIAGHLPAAVVDELADGLEATYERQLSDGLDVDTAAAATVAEFGDTDTVLAAFVEQSAGRRSART